jgi:hypothetical protein
MCANCHQQLDQGSLRGFEFEVVLADLMQASPLYTDVRLEGPGATARPDRSPPDITANSADGTQAMIVE